jgi:hypothetical protein
MNEGDQGTQSYPYPIVPAPSRRPLILAILGILAVSLVVGGGVVFVLAGQSAGPVQYEITYQLDPKVSVQSPADALETIRRIEDARLADLGLRGYSVKVEGEQLKVQIRTVPQGFDIHDVESAIGHTGLLEFVQLPPAEYGTAKNNTCPTQPQQACKTFNVGDQIDPSLPAQFTGSDLDRSEVAAIQDPSNPGAWAVGFAFNSASAKSFEEWTGQHLNEYFAIVLDGKIMSAPYIQSRITGGKGQLSGQLTEADAVSLAAILSNGALPYSIVEVQISNPKPE